MEEAKNNEIRSTTALEWGNNISRNSIPLQPRKRTYNASRLYFLLEFFD